MDRLGEALMDANEPQVPPYLATMTRFDRYAEIDEILRSTKFIQGAHWESESLYGDCLLMTDGDRHLERRRMISAMFSKASLKFYETGALDPVIDKVIDDLRTSRGDDGLVRADLIIVLRTMLHRITALVTGVDGVDTPERTERFRQYVDKLGEAVAVEWSIRDHADVLREGHETRDRLVAEFLQPSLDRRRALVREFEAGRIERKDLPIDLLTLLTMHGEDARPGDEDYIWRECALFLVAATQTTTHALPHVVIHLRDWCTDHPEDLTRLRDPEFLRLAANEGLRLHQPAPVLLRKAMHDVTLSNGRAVQAGERVALFFTPANRESEVFGADAKRFNPHRVVPPTLNPWGLTFGSGPHLCPGRPLVTGLAKRTDGETLTEGTMVKLLKRLYESGIELDPARPAKRTEASYHDAYATVPVILRDL
jgi:cytochrome P450